MLLIDNGTTASVLAFPDVVAVLEQANREPAWWFLQDIRG